MTDLFAPRNLGKQHVTPRHTPLTGIVRAFGISLVWWLALYGAYELLRSVI